MEQDAVMAQLSEFVDSGWIEPEIQVIKSGKEAQVFRCRAGVRAAPEAFVAAKIYRPLAQRRFRNDAVYQQGRCARAPARAHCDRRLQRAFAHKTQAGRRVQMGMWLGGEWETMQLLHSAGAGVPRVLARDASTILMEFIGENGLPAPALKDVAFSALDAAALFDQLLEEVTLWLRTHRIHGDLSAYNILLWEGKPVVIDFPQAVDPRSCPAAMELLMRDVCNVADYCARWGVRRDGQRLALNLWQQYVYGQL